MRKWTKERILAGLKTGNEVAIAKALSLVSRDDSSAMEFMLELNRIIEQLGRMSKVVGITGAGGVGKSSLLAALAQRLLKCGKRVAILAVDPSSPKSGGALLGDRIRIQHLFPNANLFFRSFSTRGAVGGINPYILDAIYVLEAAGFDWVFVETVGVGQDEIDIVHVCDVTALVIAPGLGDDVQFIKGGIMELADIVVLNKADLPTVASTEGALLSYSRIVENPPDIVKVSAVNGLGISKLAQLLEEKWQSLRDSGELYSRRRRRWKFQVGNWSKYFLAKRLSALTDSDLEELDKYPPRVAAVKLFEDWGCRLYEN